MKYDNLIKRMVRYSIKYNYYGILGLNSETKLELVKSVCNKAIKQSLINNLKEDLAKTNDLTQVNDAVELIIELNNL